MRWPRRPTGCCRGWRKGVLLTGRETPEGIAAFYRERGAKLVVVKLGAGRRVLRRPAASSRPRGRRFRSTQVVDTVGAGDGFAVGVVSALLAGRSVPDAVRRGAWIGARAVQVRGDTEGLPTRAELDGGRAVTGQARSRCWSSASCRRTSSHGCDSATG